MSATSVHPRGCGEHLIRGKLSNVYVGSSPRVRGTLVAPGSCLCWIRFIPAGAGNTHHRLPDTSLTPVHPRGCGEHLLKSVKDSPIVGSSPRVRGTLTDEDLEFIDRRFIPAGAGNTKKGSSQTLLHTGSSPRVRGTHPMPSHTPSATRFIPAGAGNTSPRYVLCPLSPVHPRGCGEHLCISIPTLNGSGSSPRVRGTLDPVLSPDRKLRFIPAGAGNTCSDS